MMILIKTQGSNTPVDLINGLPDCSGYTEPTLSILQAAFDDGNYVEIPDVALVIAPVVREIDARRLRLALYQLGYLAMVTAAISSLGDAAQIDWEYATFVREDYPLVQALSANLGLDVDAIFTLATSLP